MDSHLKDWNGVIMTGGKPVVQDRIALSQASYFKVFSLRRAMGGTVDAC